MCVMCVHVLYTWSGWWARVDLRTQICLILRLGTILLLMHTQTHMWRTEQVFEIRLCSKKFVCFRFTRTCWIVVEDLSMWMHDGERVSMRFVWVVFGRARLTRITHLYTHTDTHIHIGAHSTRSRFSHRSPPVSNIHVVQVDATREMAATWANVYIEHRPYTIGIVRTFVCQWSRVCTYRNEISLLQSFTLECV